MLNSYILIIHWIGEKNDENADMVVAAVEDVGADVRDVRADVENARNDILHAILSDRRLQDSQEEILNHKIECLQADDISVMRQDEHKLGDGTFGEVYAASWKKVPVAVKKFTTGNKKDCAYHLKREAFILDAVRHPLILRTYGIVQNMGGDGARGDHLHLLVVEKAAHGSLMGFVEKYPQPDEIPLFFLFAIITDVCAAVAYLHQRGVVHNDIKAENILLHNDPYQFCVKVCDFGSAKHETAMESDMHLNRTGGGTQPFMAPERLYEAYGKGSKPTTSYSDVFSICMTIIQICSRKTPEQFHDCGAYQTAIRDALLPYIKEEGDSENKQHKALTEMMAILYQGLPLPVPEGLTLEANKIPEVKFELDQFDPTKRPKAQEMKDKIEAMVKNLGGDGRISSTATHSENSECVQKFVDGNIHSTTSKRLNDELLKCNKVIEDLQTQLESAKSERLELEIELKNTRRNFRAQLHQGSLTISTSASNDNETFGRDFKNDEVYTVTSEIKIETMCISRTHAFIAIDNSAVVFKHDLTDMNLVSKTNPDTGHINAKVKYMCLNTEGTVLFVIRRTKNEVEVYDTETMELMHKMKIDRGLGFNDMVYHEHNGNKKLYACTGLLPDSDEDSSKSLIVVFNVNTDTGEYTVEQSIECLVADLRCLCIADFNGEQPTLFAGGRKLIEIYNLASDKMQFRGKHDLAENTPIYAICFDDNTNALCYCKQLQNTQFGSVHIHRIIEGKSESTQENTMLIVEEEKKMSLNAGIVQTFKSGLLRIVKSRDRSYLIVGGNIPTGSPRYDRSNKTESDGGQYRIFIWNLADVYLNPSPSKPEMLETNGIMTALCPTKDKTIMVSTVCGQIQVWKSDTTAEDGNEKES